MRIPCTSFYLSKLMRVGGATAPLMFEAKDIYLLRTKRVSRPKKFTQAIDRTVDTLFELVRNKPIDICSRVRMQTCYVIILRTVL